MPSQGSTSKLEKNSRRSVLLATTISSFLVAFMVSAANVALPLIGVEFKLDPIMLGWIQSSYFLASVVFLVPIGRIADIKGRKNIFIFGLFLYTITSLLASFSSSNHFLLSVRVFQGVGGAMIVATAVAILIEAFPEREWGKVLGINTAAVYIGVSSGPSLSGFLIQYFGWRSIFLINAPLGVLTLGLSLLKLKDDWIQIKDSKFDLLGTVVYGLGLTMIIYGVSSAFSASSNSWNVSFEAIFIPLVILVFGTFTMIGFIVWETKSHSPILDLKLFKLNKVFSYTNFATLINYSANSATSLLLSLYLLLVKGLEPEMVGLTLLPQPAIQAALSPVAGWLSDRIQARVLASLGMAITGVGLALFMFLEPSTNITFIMLNLILIGIGFAFFSSPNTNLLMSSVSDRDHGVASSMLATMRQLGMITSTIIATSVISYYVKGVEISEAPTHLLVSGVSRSFAISAVLCFIGGILSWRAVNR
ncbi:MAG: MFS transporter [Nitrososphaeria archaeon]